MPQSFNSRSASSKKGWQTRKSSKEYNSPQQVQNRREASRKAAATRYGREYVPEEITEYLKNNPEEGNFISRTDAVIENFKRSVAFATLEDIESTLKNYDKTSVPVSKTVQDLKGDDRNIILATLESAISAQGREQVAMNIEQSNITDLLNDILYASGDKSNSIGREGFQAKVDQISRILFGRAITLDESIYITYRSEQLNEGE